MATKMRFKPLLLTVTLQAGLRLNYVQVRYEKVCDMIFGDRYLSVVIQQQYKS